MSLITITSFLIVGALGGIVLHKRGVRLAYGWLFITFFVGISWFFLIFLPASSFQPLIADRWVVAPLKKLTLTFSLDSNSWVLVFSLTGWILAYLLNEIAQPNREKDPLDWFGLVFNFVPAVYALSAQNIISLIIPWTISDILEIIYRLRKNRRLLEDRRNIFKYLLRLTSIFLAIWFYLEISNISFTALPGWKELVLILIIIFRSSVLPLISTGDVDGNSHLAEDFFFRVIQFTYALKFLSFIGESAIEGASYFLLLSIFLIINVFSGFSWAREKKLAEGIPFLSLFSISLSLSVYYAGFLEVFQLFSLVYLFSGGFLSLYSRRESKIPYLFLISLFFISGLPFSFPFFIFNDLLTQEHFLVPLICVAAPYTLAILGFLNIGISSKESLKDFEPWHRLAYFIGFFLFIISAIIVLVKEYSVQFILPGINWMSIAPFVLVILIFFFYCKNKNEVQSRKEITTKKVSLNLFVKLLKLDWLTPIALGVFSFLRSLTNAITTILEGEGGILWSLLIIVLLISILKTIGTP